MEKVRIKYSDGVQFTEFQKRIIRIALENYQLEINRQNKFIYDSPREKELERNRYVAEETIEICELLKLFAVDSETWEVKDGNDNRADEN